MNSKKNHLFSSSESPPKEEDIYSVSRLNREARTLLESRLGSVWVEGELSNVSRSSADHLYFTLKDSDSEIGAVMFAGDNKDLDFEVEGGVAVLAKGLLTVYEKRGRYQLKVTEMKEAGKGALQIKFEKLKKRLKEEGLFEEEHKRPIPEFPTSIGVVTSDSGAALRDIVTTIANRYPPVSVYLFPVQVQGEQAAGEIAEAIQSAEEFSRQVNKLDLLIVGRGGGSLEDLWSFNEEVVARAIYGSTIPIISAVGHEVDFSISDFVADRRVATPTAAGKIAVPDGSQLLNTIKDTLLRLVRIQKRRLKWNRDRLDYFRRSFAFKIPFRKIEEDFQDIDDSLERMHKGIYRSISEEAKRYKDLLRRLSLANPTRMLEKGYSITLTDGKPIRDSGELEPGQIVETELYEGSFTSEVEEVRDDREQGEN